LPLVIVVLEENQEIHQQWYFVL